MAEIAAYRSAVIAFGVMGMLYIVQLLVADVVGIRRRHTPGTPVAADHSDVLFRCVRAHANTTESIAGFVLLALFAIGMGGAPGWVNGACWAFVAARAAHALSYYANARKLRSVAFGLSVLPLVVLAWQGLAAL